MKRALLTLVLALGLAQPLTAEARARHRHPAVRPVLVELFTAQGCEGCPQADQALGELARRKGVVALAFSVDIWDYTGWNDTLAQPEFTERQKAYVKRFRLRDVYTPEVVVDGSAQSESLDKAAIDNLIAKAAKAETRGPTIKLAKGGSRVQLSAGRVPPSAADVWLVRYDPKPQTVKVKAGDNRGKSLTIANAVKELVKLGQWRGKPKRFDLPEAASETLKTVVIVQAPHGGPVLAMGK
jgi:hypothetical protein